MYLPDQWTCKISRCVLLTKRAQSYFKCVYTVTLHIIYCDITYYLSVEHLSSVLVHEWRSVLGEIQRSHHKWQGDFHSHRQTRSKERPPKLLPLLKTMTGNTTKTNTTNMGNRGWQHNYQHQQYYSNHSSNHGWQHNHQTDNTTLTTPATTADNTTTKPIILL